MFNMAITGIPPYTEPRAQTLRCLCGRFYLVCLASGADSDRDQARERAARLDAQFIDARVTPWTVCSCGQALDFTGEGSACVM
ncbi:MAG: hypothetical protein L0229_04140 [Blastocatellia bacterium]|nr:hypothetical protein [Blastocatellia bacterium]